jgi:membrane protease YdiL (CAAX protease family)
MEPMRRRDALLLALSFEGGLLLLAWLLGWLLGQPPLEHTRWNWSDLGIGVATTLPLLLGLLVCIRWPVGPLGRIKSISDEFIRPVFQRCTTFDLAVISVVAGLGEEMLFRGVVQGLGDRWFGMGYGLAMASVLFGLVHLITPTYALLATLCGVYFGILVMLTDNLLVVILPHALYDFIALLYLARWSQSPELADSAPAP